MSLICVCACALFIYTPYIQYTCVMCVIKGLFYSCIFYAYMHGNKWSQCVVDDQKYFAKKKSRDICFNYSKIQLSNDINIKLHYKTIIIKQ